MAGIVNRNAKRAAASVKDDSWKAQGFINIFLPGKNGQSRKLGSISLKVSREADAQLLDRLDADPEFIKVLAQHMTFDYQAVDTESTGFDLDSMLPVEPKKKAASAK